MEIQARTASVALAVVEAKPEDPASGTLPPTVEPAPLPAPRRFMCVYCLEESGPDGKVVHADDCERPRPCVDCGKLPCACPEDEPAVEVTTGTYWRSKARRDHVLVVDSVEGDAVTVRYASDPRLPQKTTVAKVLEKLTLVARPSPKLRKALPRNSEAAQ